MKIDLAAIGRFDKSIILAGDQLAHAAAIRRQILFHIAAHAPHGVLDLPLRRGEGVANGNGNMLVLMNIAMRLVDDDVLVLRQSDAQIDLEQATLAMMQKIGAVTATVQAVIRS